jgi:molybdopterin molybdotransferase
VRLRIVDRLYTGQAPATAITSGACAEIATGAPLPLGADAVVMVEETTKDGNDGVFVAAAATEGQNIGRQVRHPR